MRYLILFLLPFTFLSSEVIGATKNLMIFDNFIKKSTNLSNPDEEKFSLMKLKLAISELKNRKRDERDLNKLSSPEINLNLEQKEEVKRLKNKNRNKIESLKIKIESLKDKLGAIK